MSNPTALVQKLWNYCNILRDDGLSYGVAGELESVVSANPQRGTRLRQSILQKAFTGNLARERSLAKPKTAEAS
jgi:hypothetical protein